MVIVVDGLAGCRWGRVVVARARPAAVCVRVWVVAMAHRWLGGGVGVVGQLVAVAVAVAYGDYAAVPTLGLVVPLGVQVSLVSGLLAV